MLVDTTVVKDKFALEGIWGSVGGAELLALTIAATPASSNAGRACDIISFRFLRRPILRAGSPVTKWF